jgi:hypothetical protein
VKTEDLTILLLLKVLAGQHATSHTGDSRKTLLPTEEETAYDFTTLWNFEGILR